MQTAKTKATSNSRLSDLFIEACEERNCSRACLILINKMLPFAIFFTLIVDFSSGTGSKFMLPNSKNEKDHSEFLRLCCPLLLCRFQSLHPSAETHGFRCLTPCPTAQGVRLFWEILHGQTFIIPQIQIYSSTAPAQPTTATLPPTRRVRVSGPSSVHIVLPRSAVARPSKLIHGVEHSETLASPGYGSRKAISTVREYGPMAVMMLAEWDRAQSQRLISL